VLASLLGTVASSSDSSLGAALLFCYTAGNSSEWFGNHLCNSSLSHPLPNSLPCAQVCLRLWWPPVH
jgi:hypothetical protein